jgi:hypothetical protein
VSRRPSFDWDGYRAYCWENPHVFPLLARFVIERVTRTTGRFSMKAVVERARWETAITTDDAEGYKINDRWTAFHARRFIQCHPEHADRLEFRRSVADRGAWPGEVSPDIAERVLALHRARSGISPDRIAAEYDLPVALVDAILRAARERAG